MIPSLNRIAATLLGAALFALAHEGESLAADELKVTATTKPVHSLVAQVMKGLGTPALLVKGSSSPHTYALRPSDAQALNASDAVFRISEAIEPFTAKIVDALPANVRVVTLSDAPGVKRLPIRSGKTFEPHSHGPRQAKHAELGYGREHMPDAENAEEHPPYDGHLWLDPENARHMVAEIARVLSEVSPANAATFKHNAERYSAEITALEALIEKELEPVKAAPFVTFHDAYQYFEHRFGLTAVGSITVNPEVHPSARRLSEIRERIRSLGAKCVFVEPKSPSGLIAAVIEGTGAQAAVLDPEATTIEPGPDAYATLLSTLATSLRSCLEARR